MRQPLNRRQFLVVTALAATGQVRAQTEAPTRELKRINKPGADMARPAAAERVALVIGNANYAHGRLRNPVNDARGMAAALRQAGFNIIEDYDVDRKKLTDRLEEFHRMLLESRGTGFFYYAGHGVQYEKQNFLIPIGAQISRGYHIPSETVSANRVLDDMDNAGNRLNIVVLDACRDNPFPGSRKMPSSAVGLAGMNAQNRRTETFIGYATERGSVASDGRGNNSPYAEHLIRLVAEPGLEIHEVFRRVGAAVKRDTSNQQKQQKPWIESSVTTPFLFRPGRGARPPTPATPPGTAGIAAVGSGPKATVPLVAAGALALGGLAWLWRTRQRISAATTDAGLQPLNRETLGALYAPSAVAYLCRGDGTPLSPLFPGRPLVVGRSSRAALTLHDDGISGRHLQVDANAQGDLHITDLASTNGVFLRGQRLQADTAHSIKPDEPFNLGTVHSGLRLRRPEL